MKVHIKLFSVLRQYWPDYDPQTGAEVELPAGACVADMLVMLNIPPEKSALVACQGRMLKPTDALQKDSILHIFQPVAGG